MPYCRCGNEFPEARARLGFDCCLECGSREAAAEVARRAYMIAPVSHKSSYTYLGPNSATQRQRLLEGSAKTPAMAMAARVIGPAARPRNAKPANAKPANAKPANAKPRRYEFVGWEFKPDKLGVRQKRAILRDLRSD